ncbi:MAG: DUF6714 family protein [Bacteroidota bacterium]
MPDYQLQKVQLLALIHEAFDQVILGNGVSLHETIEIDDFGSLEARKKARERDEKRDWRKLIQDPELAEISAFGGLSFYDDMGLRFHLPAYMCLVLDQGAVEVSGSLLFHLTDISDYNRQRFAILHEAQRQAVRAFLIYVRNQPNRAFEFDFPAIDEALTTYWTA